MLCPYPFKEPYLEIFLALGYLEGEKTRGRNSCETMTTPLGPLASNVVKIKVPFKECTFLHIE
jgi:hypothetical protein